MIGAVSIYAIWFEKEAKRIINDEHNTYMLALIHHLKAKCRQHYYPTKEFKCVKKTF